MFYFSDEDLVLTSSRKICLLSASRRSGVVLGRVAGLRTVASSYAPGFDVGTR